jgi:hypothetical protein
VFSKYRSWRARAAEARAMADQMDETYKQMMVAIAEDYDLAKS